MQEISFSLPHLDFCSFVASLFVAGPAIASMLYVFLRVAIDAPRHRHCCDTAYSVHRLHRSVAFLTREAGTNMALMRKVHKIRKIVNFNPRDRFTIFPVAGQFQDLRTFANTGYGVVASHAFANAGYAGNRRLVGIDVTMLARNLVVRCMYHVTEFDWLNRTAIGKIFAVYPCARKKSCQEYKSEHGWLLRGLERFENGDGQLIPPTFGARVCP